MSSNNTENIYASEYTSTGRPIPADIIGYDNTESGLTAENAQSAIDELAGDIADLSADDISYDNTDSGLTADDVQSAIDEIVGDIGNIVEMPALPAASADGTYVLKATAADGTITYAWVLEV